MALLADQVLSDLVLDLREGQAIRRGTTIVRGTWNGGEPRKRRRNRTLVDGNHGTEFSGAPFGSSMKIVAFMPTSSGVSPDVFSSSLEIS